MRMADIIEHKKQGLALTKEEIDFFVKEYTNGDIPDYQASALAMAIYFNKMTNEETAALTLAMAKSGDMLDLSEFKNSTVDIPPAEWATKLLLLLRRLRQRQAVLLQK